MAAARGARGHPSLDIVGSDGAGLAGRRVVLCVSGSVAAYKAIELARLLMRHGADVTCVASGAATRLVRPDYLRWATGNEVVTRLTGVMEHVKLADRGRADLVIAYPATANTLGKLANGIDDTPVSTVLTIGLGAGIPVIMGLAMHAAMYTSAAVRRNVAFLRGKVALVGPRIAEGKARAPEPEEVLAEALRMAGRSGPLAGRRVLVTAGPTVERIDPVRAITSSSTGRTGTLLAAEMAAAGARVTLVYGPGREPPPAGARLVRVESAAEMGAAVRRELRRRHDVVVMAAAVSDYTVARPRRSKIRSGRRGLVVRLARAPKIIDGIRAMQPGAFIVGFKAEAGVTEAALEAAASRRMAAWGADMVVANDVGGAYAKDPGRNRVLVLGRGRRRRTGRVGKAAIARVIREEIERGLAAREGAARAGRGAHGAGGGRTRRRLPRGRPAARIGAD